MELRERRDGPYRARNKGYGRRSLSDISLFGMKATNWLSGLSGVEFARTSLHESAWFALCFFAALLRYTVDRNDIRLPRNERNCILAEILTDKNRESLT
jgi:hypothetical protein